MGIQKNTSYFHDGSIYTIKHEGKNMEIAMESAQVAEEDLLEPVTLSSFNSIKGILHIIGIINIIENDLVYKGEYRMKTNDGGIHDFNLESNKLELQIAWNTIPYDPKTSDFSVLKIEAEKIYWENVPDLVNPHW